jgi:hypothetical protein
VLAIDESGALLRALAPPSVLSLLRALAPPSVRWCKPLLPLTCLPGRLPHEVQLSPDLCHRLCGREGAGKGFLGNIFEGREKRWV